LFHGHWYQCFVLIFALTDGHELVLSFKK
jgi:hypothetical protein